MIGHIIIFAVFLLCGTIAIATSGLCAVLRDILFELHKLDSNCNARFIAEAGTNSVFRNNTVNPSTAIDEQL